jgi:hypothetical protein
MEVSEIDPESGHPQDSPVSAQKIIEEIKSLEKELIGIQESCSHPKYTVKNCQDSSTKEIKERIFLLWKEINQVDFILFSNYN